MAHELTLSGGRYEFAYAGEAPWHSLGQKLPARSTKEQIIEAAGLGWIVVPEPVYTCRPDPLNTGLIYTPIDGFVANMRSDNREILGVVSNDYKIVQNGDAFTFMDEVVELATAMYETAGSIRKGRQVFASAKLPDSIVVTPDDVVNQYLMFCNAHDGTGGFHIRYSPIRVVCANTLGAALARNTPYQYTIRHMGDLKAHLREARTALGVGSRYFKLAGETYRALSAKQINTAMLDTFLSGFVPVPTVDAASSADAVKARDKALEIHGQIRQLFETGKGADLPGVRGTVWGAVNAGIEWAERVRTVNKDGSMRKGAAEAYVFGYPGQELRDRAFQTGVALLG